jgi:hypothetical protein
MATSNKKNQTFQHIQPKKVIIMRKTQKVARVSMYCKLNMLVPHLKSLSARIPAETNEKNRSNTNKH